MRPPIVARVASSPLQRLRDEFFLPGLHLLPTAFCVVHVVSAWFPLVLSGFRVVFRGFRVVFRGFRVGFRVVFRGFPWFPRIARWFPRGFPWFPVVSADCAVVSAWFSLFSCGFRRFRMGFRGLSFVLLQILPCHEAPRLTFRTFAAEPAWFHLSIETSSKQSAAVTPNLILVTMDIGFTEQVLRRERATAVD